MRAVLQRASRASVVVDGDEVASFDRQGIVALVGVTHEDGTEQAETIARKVRRPTWNQAAARPVASRWAPGSSGPTWT